MADILTQLLSLLGGRQQPRIPTTTHPGAPAKPIGQMIARTEAEGRASYDAGSDPVLQALKARKSIEASNLDAMNLRAGRSTPLLTGQGYRPREAGQPQYSTEELYDYGQQNMPTASWAQLMNRDPSMRAESFRRMNQARPPEPVAHRPSADEVSGLLAQYGKRKVTGSYTQEQLDKQGEVSLRRARDRAARQSRVHQFAAMRKMARDMRQGRMMPGGVNPLQAMMMGGDPEMAKVAASLMLGQQQMGLSRDQMDLGREEMQQRGTLGHDRIAAEERMAELGLGPQQTQAEAALLGVKAQLEEIQRQRALLGHQGATDAFNAEQNILDSLVSNGMPYTHAAAIAKERMAQYPGIGAPAGQHQDGAEQQPVPALSRSVLPELQAMEKDAEGLREAVDLLRVRGVDIRTQEGAAAAGPLLIEGGFGNIMRERQALADPRQWHWWDPRTQPRQMRRLVQGAERRKEADRQVRILDALLGANAG